MIPARAAPGTVPAQEIEIAPAVLAAWRAAGEPHALLDVREPWEIAIAALPEALAVPLAELPGAVATLPRDVPLVVLCHHGARSLRVTLWLRGQGFANATNLAGGIHAWSETVDPAVPTY